MSREFHRFYDLVMAEGLLDATSEVAQRFKAVTENFMRLSGGNTGEAGYISPEDERTTVVDDFQGRNDAGTGSSAEGQSPQKSMPESNHSGQQNVVPVQETDPDAINSYEVVAQATPDNASFPLYGAMEVVPNLSGFASINSPFATLPLTSSLSYHELSFGRRLQRRTTERGLFLASMPNPPPERYAAVFGFSLLFESRDSIMRRLSQQLANMVMPFQDQANTQKGPFEEKMDQRIRLTFGFEKEFLNADEVEMYLHERGIIIPQQVEFVDAEVDVNDLSDAMPPAMPPAMNPQGYYSPQSSAFDGQNSAHVPVTMAMSVAGNPNNAMVQHMQMQPSNAASMLPCMCGPGMNNVWGATSWQKAKLTISVGVLVEGKHQIMHVMKGAILTSEQNWPPSPCVWACIPVSESKTSITPSEWQPAWCKHAATISHHTPSLFVYTHTADILFLRTRRLPLLRFDSLNTSISGPLLAKTKRRFEWSFCFEIFVFGMEISVSESLRSHSVILYCFGSPYWAQIILDLSGRVQYTAIARLFIFHYFKYILYHANLRSNLHNMHKHRTLLCPRIVFSCCR